MYLAEEEVSLYTTVARLCLSHPMVNIPHVGDKVFYFSQGHWSTNVPHKVWNSVVFLCSQSS